MNYEEEKKFALEEWNKRMDALEEWLMKPVSECKPGKGILEQVMEGEYVNPTISPEEILYQQFTHGDITLEQYLKWHDINLLIPATISKPSTSSTSPKTRAST